MTAVRPKLNLIALAGAQGTGKSTLMHDLAEDLYREGYRVDVLCSPIAATLKALAKPPDVVIPFTERLGAQNKLLENWSSLWFKAAVNPNTLWIADRSWLDLASYTLGDVRRDITSTEDTLCQAYLKRCAQWRDKMHMVRVPLTFDVEDRPGQFKSSRARSSRLLLDATLSGLMHSDEWYPKGSPTSWSLPKEFDARELRVQWIKQVAFGFGSEPPVVHLEKW